jgi:hypothetical protein
MGIHKLLHDIVTELPIHEGRKADLHKQVDETVEKDEEDGTVNGTGSADGSGS